MISSVSFNGLQPNSSAKDLYGTPQRFQRTTPYAPDAPETKKSGVGKKIAIGVGIAAAVATALALLAKKGKLDPKTLEEGANFLQKGWEGAKKGMKAAGDFIADKSIAAWNAVKNLIPKKAETPAA
ncbi:hypothetical protein IJI31_07600 [bacterium]|nr:hypothetical protein [bacterium]